MTNREIALLCAKEVVAAKRHAEMNCLPFTLGSAASIIEGVLDRCCVSAKVKRSPSKSPAKMADDAWICSLEVEPSLAGVDVRREIGKAQFWAKNNRRQATRKFIINWLAKAERTLLVQMDGQTSLTKVKLDPYTAPPGWQDTAALLYPNTDYFTGKSWGDVALDYRKAIVQRTLSA